MPAIHSKKLTIEWVDLTDSRPRHRTPQFEYCELPRVSHVLQGFKIDLESHVGTPGWTDDRLKEERTKTLMIYCYLWTAVELEAQTHCNYIINNNIIITNCEKERESTSRAGGR